MDLRNNQITVKELLSNSNARVYLIKEIPEIMNSPFIGMAGNLKLCEVITYSASYLPKCRIDTMLNGLKEL